MMHRPLLEQIVELLIVAGMVSYTGVSAQDLSNGNILTYDQYTKHNSFWQYISNEVIVIANDYNSSDVCQRSISELVSMINTNMERQQYRVITFNVFVEVVITPITCEISRKIE